jgi:hypothetical protein
MAGLVGLALPARAGEGVVGINAALAAQGGVTPGDAPGFPVTISSRGSYRLTGDLVVSSTSANGVTIAADDVTLDLAGFSITGPGSGSGTGIFLSGRANVEIRNGTIRAFGAQGIHENGGTARAHRVLHLDVRDVGGDGIRLGGESHRVHACHASTNGTAQGLTGSGIFVGVASLVTGSHASENWKDGIRASDGSVLRDNVARENHEAGIVAGQGSAVAANSSHSNDETGIQAGSYSSVQANAARENGGIGIATGGGSSVGRNAAAYNTLRGIAVGEGSAVVGNAARSNQQAGIEAASGSVVVENTARYNAGFGLDLGSPVGYGGNVLRSNTGGTVQGGVEIDANVCGTDTTCP